MTIPYPYTDETPKERRIHKPLITENGVGIFIYAGKESGDSHLREDVSVFISHGVGNHSDWVCTLEGSPGEPARAFVFKSRQELQDVIEALMIADQRLSQMGTDIP